MKITFTKNHILQVFKEVHKIVSKVDPVVDSTLEVTEELLLEDWISEMDLIPKWKVQYKAFNLSYNVNIPESEFHEMYCNRKSNLGDLANLISIYSTPINIPEWKFAGKLCKKGSILRFILGELESVIKTEKKLHPRDGLNRFTNYRDWSWVDRLNSLFPGTIPPSKEISHSRLLPKSIRIIRNVGLFTFIFGLLVFFLGLFISQNDFTYSGIIISISTFIFLFIHKKVVKIPKTTHEVFLGISSIRSYSLLVFERFFSDTSSTNSV